MFAPASGRETRLMWEGAPSERCAFPWRLERTRLHTDKPSYLYISMCRDNFPLQRQTPEQRKLNTNKKKLQFQQSKRKWHRSSCVLVLTEWCVTFTFLRLALQQSFNYWWKGTLDLQWTERSVSKEGVLKKTRGIQDQLHFFFFVEKNEGKAQIYL